jgi:hypothetical protein
MAFSEDMKAYRDAAVEQGKRAIDQAQAVLSDLADEANKQAAKAQERGQSLVAGVRTFDRTKVMDTARTDLEAFLSAFEPYVAEAKRLRDALVDRTEHVVTDARKDPRVAKAYENAEALAETVVSTVNERVLAPTLSFVRRSSTDNGQAESKPTAGKPSTAGTTPPTATDRSDEEKSGQKRAATTPGAKKAPARKTTARKSTATKAASSGTATKAASSGTATKAASAAKRTTAKRTDGKRPAAESSGGSTS